MKQKGYIVTHTHWDREWRYPLWENRMYLVDLMEELLEILDSDPDYTSFLMDGQTVAIEDYLEVRPEDKDRIQKYIKEGRIKVGPWYTLPDLYPLDGECLVRNLLKGKRMAKDLGGCLNVAYESFGWGQISQFPQIYKGFGMDVVVVAKKVSNERAPESEFLWEGVDGTRILATRLGEDARANLFMNAYLKIMNGVDYGSDEYRLDWNKAGMLYHQADEQHHIQDYFKFGSTEKIHEELIEEAFEDAWAKTHDTTVKSHRVLMNGSDSTTPQPLLTKVVEKANALFDDKEFVIASMDTYTDQLKALVDYDALKVVKGELRDGPASACSANALMTRPYIKILNKQVENTLLRSAEPLSVVGAMMGERYDKTFLDKAMKYMLLSHPHDSINGVTQDKTVDDVMYMLNQSLEIGEVINNRVCANIVKNIDMTGFDSKDILMVVVNPLPKNRSDILKVYIDIPRELNLWDFDLIDSRGNIRACQSVSKKEVVIPVSDLHARPWPYYADRHCVYMDTGQVPAGGYKVYKVSPKKSFNRTTMFWADMRTSRGQEIGASTNTMENEFLKVTVEKNGTLGILDKKSGKTYANLNYFEDTGDCGDYWMYYPPHNNKTYTSMGSDAKIWMEDNGELSATIGTEITMMLPAYAHRPENEIRGESKRSDEEKELTIKTYYTLKKGSNKVDVQLVVDNTVEDHRLRVLFDTGIKAEYADASGHFTVDRRPVKPPKDKDGIYYPEMQTLPMQKFVDLSDGDHGLAVVNNCLIEYEAMDNDRGTLALTLLRGVRNIICTEKRSGGVFPTQNGGQSLGTREYDYAIYPHEGQWHEADVYKEAEAFNTPLRPIQTNKSEGGDLPLEHSFYSLEPSNLVMSSFKKAEDRDSYILRLFNPTGTKIDGKFSIHAAIKEAFTTDLDENRLEEVVVISDRDIELDIEGNKIVTIEVVL